jgi:purine-binding chemotaxis protein CheW
MNKKNKKRKELSPEDMIHASEEKQRIVLPQYGFAEDILAVKEKMQSADVVDSSSQVIYTFADRLKEKQKTETVQEEVDSIETWVVFALVNELYALPVTHVQEILRAVAITRVPDAPHPVRGITNMRGSVLPVVDLRVRLGLKKARIEPANRILVVDSRKRLIGLLVDSVHEVKRIAANKVQLPPEDVMTKKSDYILGVYQAEDNLIILLDVDRVLLIHDIASKEASLLKQKNKNEINGQEQKGD